MRQVVLDTETTGLEVKQGHRIIEIGCVELLDRRLSGVNFHEFVNPERPIDEGAQAVHGISIEQLQDKPVFADIVERFLDYIRGSELIIHNAPFDIGFLDHELQLAGDYGCISDYCTTVDTLVMARSRHPGQKNNLDALCKRYEVDNAQRVLHGALLDAEILADVYLRMTGGQVSLFDETDSQCTEGRQATVSGRPTGNDLPLTQELTVVTASEKERQDHEAFLQRIAAQCGGESLWASVQKTETEAGS
ncbi:MAG: DNA polymerase III subunit epsilon [Gammaproteobacteria bacterium]|nr:MAG: DNA polymerase III subunit epsilon [Gammaproteobacteria bacterium]